MSENQSVIEKVRKLLALSEGNSNEHEREVAMQFAMELLGKHNLSIAEIGSSSLERAVCSVEFSLKLEKWITNILKAVSSLYYTDFYRTVRNTAIFVGTAGNIAVSIDVAEWLVDSIRKESNRLYKDPYQRRSFRAGAAGRVFMRAFDLRFEEKRSTSITTAGTSLAVVRTQLEEANDEFLSRLNLRQTRTRTSYVDGESFDKGSSFADGIALTKQAKRLPQYV